MLAGPGPTLGRPLRPASDTLVVLVILIGGAVAASALSHDPRRAGASSLGPDEAPPLALSVDPPSWWMLAGNATSLWATWTGVPPGCLGAPLWYRWTVIGGFAEGSLTPSEGPSTNFTASAESTGTAEVEVRSALLVSCGTSRLTAIRDAMANLSVVAPLTLENLTISPNPLTAGGVARLSALIVNGDPPYRLRVDWGDGNISFYNVTEPGPVSFSHRFSNGSFVPTIFVTDSAGLVANGSADEALSVSSGLATAVDTPTAVAEVGIPVPFSGVILHPPAEFGFLSSCSDADPSDSATDSGAAQDENFTCVFAAPGVADVYFEVIPVAYNLSVVDNQLAEPVVAPLELGLGPPPATGEVGMPTVVLARISGGVAPFHVTWRVVGNSSEQEKTCYADGAVALPVWPSVPGTYAVTVSVTDAVGVLVENGSTDLPVDPGLQAAATAGSSLGSSGATVAISGSVTGGAPPFEWWVEPSVAPANASAGNGSLASVGVLTWNATFSVEGNASVSILVVDQDGSEWSVVLAVTLVPPLSVAAHLNGSSAGSARYVALNLSLEGGLPPFEANLTSSLGESWNHTIQKDGAYSWTFPTNDTGPLTVHLSVHDRLGGAWSQIFSVVLPPSNSSTAPSPPPPPGTAPAPSPSVPAGGAPPNAWLDMVGLASVAGVLGVSLLLWRRRRRSGATPSAPPDPVTVLRRIVEPAEGAERSTVELLAEEAGVPSELVRTTIDRLVAEGTLRVESDEEGEEVLAWSDRT